MNVDRDIEILKYIYQQIEQINDYTRGYTEDVFLRDDKTKDAVLTKLMVIGEYGHKVDETIKKRYVSVDWKAMKLARNYYAHVYRGIDWILVWHVVANEIPSLENSISSIIADLMDEGWSDC